MGENFLGGASIGHGGGVGALPSGGFGVVGGLALGIFFFTFRRLERGIDQPRRAVAKGLLVHGARVYGADFIPIRSYEVPFLIYAPALVKPGKVDTLACSMDVAPTLLGLTNWTFQSTFFGRDLFDVPKDQGYALMQHDRDVGFLRGDRLAVYRPDKSANLYLFDRATTHFNPAPPAPGDEDIVQDGAAIYQTAYELYVQQRLRLKNGRP